ncbi:MAG: heme ABC exporter ATP-binding protein CcmA [Burkholderiaceae bacterium]
MNALELVDLSCAAGYRTLFAGLGLVVEPGSWAMLTGPNGSGKSTLLRTIAGLAQPIAGVIRWHGVDLATIGRRWHSIMLYQGHQAGAKDAFSTRENLAWQVRLDCGHVVADARLDAALARVGLSRQARLPFARLSAGQRRRLQMARLTLNVGEGRPLWLLDEPTTALDAPGQALLGEIVDAHLAAGGCAVVATHQVLGIDATPTHCELARPASPPDAGLHTR